MDREKEDPALLEMFDEGGLEEVVRCGYLNAVHDITTGETMELAAEVVRLRARLQQVEAENERLTNLVQTFRDACELEQRVCCKAADDANREVARLRAALREIDHADD